MSKNLENNLNNKQVFNYEELYIWQEREVRFDVLKKEISLRKGEKQLDTVSNIEDSKGNNGDVGCIIFTNLRLIWFSIENLKLNLSIGYDCILASDVKLTNSKVSGECTALFIKVKFGNSRFEFVFNAVGNSSPQLFNTFVHVIKLYERTRIYRDIKYKNFLSMDKKILKLNLENFYFKVKNVSLITLSKGEEIVVNEGEFIVSNVRIIWFCPNIENYCVSLPWIDIRMIKEREHKKYGQTIMIESNKFFGSLIVNFKFNSTNSKNTFDDLLNKVLEYHNEHLNNPVLGIIVERDEDGEIIEPKAEPTEIQNKQLNNIDNNVNINNKTDISTNKTNNNNNNNKSNTEAIKESNQLDSKSASEIKMNNTSINNSEIIKNTNSNLNNKKATITTTTEYNQEYQSRIYNKLMKEFPDDLEIIDTNIFNDQSALQVYLSEKSDIVNNNIKDIIFNTELGLAIEKIPNNLTIEKIWKIET